MVFALRIWGGSWCLGWLRESTGWAYTYRSEVFYTWKWTNSFRLERMNGIRHSVRFYSILWMMMYGRRGAFSNIIRIGHSRRMPNAKRIQCWPSCVAVCAYCMRVQHAWQWCMILMEKAIFNISMFTHIFSIHTNWWIWCVSQWAGVFRLHTEHYVAKAFRYLSLSLALCVWRTRPGG